MADGTRKVIDSIRALPHWARAAALSGALGARALVPRRAARLRLAERVPGRRSHAGARLLLVTVRQLQRTCARSGSNAEGPVIELERRAALAAVLRSVFLFLLVCTTLYIAADFFAYIAFLLFLRYLSREVKV